MDRGNFSSGGGDVEDMTTAATHAEGETDAALIRASASCPDAFVAVFRRHYDAVRTFAGRGRAGSGRRGRLRDLHARLRVAAVVPPDPRGRPAMAARHRHERVARLLADRAAPPGEPRPSWAATLAGGSRIPLRSTCSRPSLRYRGRPGGALPARLGRPDLRANSGLARRSGGHRALPDQPCPTEARRVLAAALEDERRALK